MHHDILLSYDNSIPNLFKQLYTYKSKSNIYNNYIFYIAVIITVSTFNINDLI